MINLKAAVQKIAGAALVTGAITVQAVSLEQDAHRYEVSTNKLERFLADYVTDNFSGAILIAQNDKILHAQGYGFANREKAIPNRLDTVYETGALTHYFTAAAVLKLVEKNKLALDDKLGDFFDNVPENKQDITIHHLLTHTSGLIGDQDVDAFKQVDTKSFLKDVFSKRNSIDVAVYLPTFTFSPGERSITFIEGYNLLTLIVEQRSGQSFEAFLNDHLFEAVGIKSTGYQIPDWKPQQLANGYLGPDGETWGNLADRLAEKDKLPLYLQGSMGLLSTVEDIYAWHQALHAGKILREDLVELLHTRHIGLTAIDEADIDYGYGIKLSETWLGTTWISNVDSQAAKSNIPGFTTKYHYLPDDNIVVIYASNENVDRGFYDTINRLVRVLLEPEYETSHANTRGRK